MTSKDYQALMTRLEREHAVSPERYRAKTVFLALAGLSYPLALCLLLGIAVIAVVQHAVGATTPILLHPALALGLIALPLLYALVRVPLPAPGGRRLRRKETAKLFALIDKVRTKSARIRIDGVRLTGEFELRLHPTPRLGLFGYARNTLMLGLPLMQILSRKEFAALLAHEIEHASGSQGRTSAWIYRLRETWRQSSQAVRTGNSSFLTRLAWWPLKSFIPYFEAFSFVMARQNEYLADRLGGQVVGKRLMADALIAQALGQRFLAEQFWPNFWAQAETQPHPAFPPHGTLRTALAAGITAERNEAWLNQALKQASSRDDTPPCLSDRLLALDQFPEVPPRSTQSAAQALLGRMLPELIKEFDSAWTKTEAPHWEARHLALTKAREVANIFAPCKFAELLAQDQYRYGMALHTLGRTDEARELFQLAADSPQGSAAAAITLARLLRDTDAEAAHHYRELAIRQDARLANEAGAQADHAHHGFGSVESATVARAALHPQQAA
ncbi:MAG: hypothetical protein RJA63_3144 [Pseudomonadota bacterium]|jgi:Zn-dependent protease with chaperone function